MIPNLLSAFRLLLIPFILLALIRGMKYPTLGLMVVSGVTDWVDGWVARRFGQITSLGKVLDPLGDKLTIGVVSLYLGWVGKLPWWIVVVVVGKDVVILFAGLAFFGKNRTVPVSDVWGKVAALAAGALIVVCAMDWEMFVEPFVILTVITVAISLVSYAWKYIGQGISLKEER